MNKYYQTVFIFCCMNADSEFIVYLFIFSLNYWSQRPDIFSSFKTLAFEASVTLILSKLFDLFISFPKDMQRILEKNVLFQKLPSHSYLFFLLLSLLLLATSLLVLGII